MLDFSLLSGCVQEAEIILCILRWDGISDVAMPTWPALRTMRSIDRMPAVHRTPAEHEYPAVIIHTLDTNPDPSLDLIRISLKFSLQLRLNASYRAQSLILAKSWDLIDKYDLVWLTSTISIRCTMPYPLH